MVWLVMLRGRFSRSASVLFLVLAALVLACGFVPSAAVAAIPACLVVAAALLERDRLHSRRS
ncbi:MAG: hypothetical protein QM607_06955 [Microbacterium sp.]